MPFITHSSIYVFAQETADGRRSSASHDTATELGQQDFVLSVAQKGRTTLSLFQNQ